MNVKTIAFGALMSLGFVTSSLAAGSFGIANSARADVIQTTTGIQQSEQVQYAEGGNSIIQNSSNVQQLQQRAEAREERRRRPRRRRRRGNNNGGGGNDNRLVQQSTTGVQTSVQAQDAIGGRRITQNAIDVESLIQDSFANFRR